MLSSPPPLHPLQNCLKSSLLLSKLNQIISKKAKIAFLLSTHYVAYINYVSNVCVGCASVHLKQPHYSVEKCAMELLKLTPNLDYQRKCHLVNLLPSKEQLLFNKCVLVLKVAHGRAPLSPRTSKNRKQINITDNRLLLLPPPPFLLLLGPGGGGTGGWRVVARPVFQWQ